MLLQGLQLLSCQFLQSGWYSILVLAELHQFVLITNEPPNEPTLYMI
jgi:hypothetical protein